MDDDSDEILGIGWRDILTNLLGVAFTIVISLAVLISVKTQEQTESTTPPGNLVVTIVWPDGTPDDVDLWIYSEGEKRPIGYSNKTGLHWSLLRDDLGTVNDTVPANFESAYSRDVVAGHYVFNIVCYSCKGEFPVTVDFELRLVSGGNNHALLTATVDLTMPRQEVTIVQFDLSKDGKIVSGSTHNLFKPLFQAWK